MSAVITPFQGTEPFNTASFNNRISQINTGFSYVSNPNLLDNWYFANPVNQRGQTSYGQTQQYSIDRWMITNDYAYVDVADGYITLRGNDVNGFGGIIEKLESSIKNALLGKTVTLSFFAKLYTTCAIAGQQITPTDNFELYSITFLSSSADYVLFAAVTAVTTGAKIADILAAKLELGPTQTLAHREGDRWVLNEVPNYGEQLRRCQRYFYRFNSHAYGWTYNNNIVNCLIPLPVTLRATPVITLYESGTINTVTGDAAMSSYEVKNIASNGLIIDLHNTANAFTTGTPVVWHNFNMAISADL
nr:MAG TPA: hypothetical protein [Caudoviricetes sp.]